MKWNCREDSLELSLIFELQVFDEVVAHVLSVPVSGKVQ